MKPWTAKAAIATMVEKRTEKAGQGFIISMKTRKAISVHWTQRNAADRCESAEIPGLFVAQGQAFFRESAALNHVQL
jgi:hypothetical protein